MTTRLAALGSVLPAHLAEAGERAPEVGGIEPAVGVVVRQMAEPRAVRSDVDGGEGLVGERGDVGPCP